MSRTAPLLAQAHPAPPPPGRALLIKPSSFGDIIHALPAARALRRAWPKTDLRWLIQPAWAPLLDANPDIDAVIPFPRERFRGPLGPIRFLRWARQASKDFRPDIVVDLQGLLRSAIAARLYSANVIAGGSDAREGSTLLHTRSIAVDAAQHAVRRNLAIAEALGGISHPIEFPLPAGVRPNLPDTADTGFILLHPFARGKGKSLDTFHVERLCALLSSLAPLRVVVVGQSKARHALPPNTINLIGSTSLPELIWLARNARAAISVDSGPMHLAAALGTPLVAIHTWSDPARVAPWSSNALVWQSGTILPAEEFLNRRRGGIPGPLPDDASLAAIAAAAVNLARLNAS